MAMTLAKELLKSGILNTNLHGVAKILARELGLEKLPVSLDDKVKAEQRNNNNMVYPYGWLVPSDGQAVKDQGNNRNIQQFGLTQGTRDATRNQSSVGFVFPVRVGMELHYIDDDAQRLFHTSEALLILSAISRLSFDIRFGDKSRPESCFMFNTRIEIPDSVTIPFADTGDTTKPGGIELTVPLIIHTQAGFFRKVASVYDVDPTIGTSAKPNDAEDVELDEYQTIVPEEFRANDPRIP